MKIEDIPVGEWDAAVVLDFGAERAYSVEQLAGNRYNLWEVDLDAQDVTGEPKPFESLSDALRALADKVE